MLVAGDQLLKIVIILCVGMVATLLFTAQTAVVIRALVRTENKEVRRRSRCAASGSAAQPSPASTWSLDWQPGALLPRASHPLPWH